MTDEFIIIADDHPIFREGIFALVRQLLPHSKIASTDTLDAALEIARANPFPPSMFILDLFFEGNNIVSNLRALREEFRLASIVVVTMASDKALVDTVMNAGINGFINKAALPDEIKEILRAVREGDVVVQVPVSTNAIASYASPALSQRQLDVLHLLAEGRTNKEIAIILGISPFTVRIHVSAIFRALGVATRAGAVTKGIAMGLVPTSPGSSERNSDSR
ncbi:MULTISPECIES: response regulator transcription factor [Rhizobium/Agrobacterium group]|uniref:response regulator transcription factor n=1 Tax=Rhizobium/Agrobacterium group TaxID=227290 RepID=UPI000B3FDCCF|nr:MULTISPECIES: response regulator transcription factor [Rhizobium/Agrobacterium group]MCF1460530.1 response regulator transcription factor [Allorhizobium ampelinum]MCF1472314.1 response regulator transcription factor [Allorhizobium ampelinum]MCF1480849.1 response regulator transcription factor [Allorhizobium ampelinum]MVA49514.1 response regulator [Agrobacterium vitis]MVA69670.1 response regulator [Agrobacterium vitis]